VLCKYINGKKTCTIHNYECIHRNDGPKQTRLHDDIGAWETKERVHKLVSRKTRTQVLRPSAGDGNLFCDIAENTNHLGITQPQTEGIVVSTQALSKHFAGVLQRVE
jgi:hypothetical protein